jgi:hypothetical protein
MTSSDILSVLTLCTAVVQVFGGGLLGGDKVLSLCGKLYCQSGADEDHSVMVYDAVQISVHLRYCCRMAPYAYSGYICTCNGGVRLIYLRVVKLRRFQCRNYRLNYSAAGSQDTNGMSTLFAVGVRWFVSEVATVLRLARDCLMFNFSVKSYIN